MSFEETGRKDDGNKPDLGLIYPMLLIQTAHVLKEGDEIYGSKNWQGLMVSRVVSAMDRHLLAIKSGEDIDPKSGKPHYAHIASGCSFLAWFMENGVMGGPQDDRPWRHLQPDMPFPCVKLGTADEDQFINAVFVSFGNALLDHMKALKIFGGPDPRFSPSMVGVPDPAGVNAIGSLCALDPRCRESNDVIPCPHHVDAPREFAEDRFPDEVDGEFEEWLTNEMPNGTVISDSKWWARKIAKTLHTSKFRDLEVQIRDGKEQWDTVANFIGADGDDIDQVFAVAKALRESERAGIGDDIARVMQEVSTWADEAIGADRTYNNAIQKMVMEELPELLLSPEDPLEWADVMIICLDLAHLAGINPAQAVREKLDINRKRVWAKDAKTGLVHHVKPIPGAELFLSGDRVTLKGDNVIGTVWTVDRYDPVKHVASVFCEVTYPDGAVSRYCSTVPMEDLVRYVESAR